MAAVSDNPSAFPMHPASPAPIFSSLALDSDNHSLRAYDRSSHIRLGMHTHPSAPGSNTTTPYRAAAHACLLTKPATPLDTDSSPQPLVICNLAQTHLAVLLLKKPPVMFTTVGVPHATSAPPSSRARLSLNVPPSIVTLEPPNSKLSPEQ